jgi:hypothetical protein
MADNIQSPNWTLDSVLDDIQAKADKIQRDVSDYFHHVLSGEDPTTLPNNGSWWTSQIKPYAESIVNAIRVEQGKPPNPFHPAGSVAFKLFDHLLDANTWVPVSELRSITRGQHVTTFLRRINLERAGYWLDKDKVNGTTCYMLVALGDGMVDNA